MGDNRILLEHTCNTRHLGGYDTKFGKKTKDYSFIRSDVPAKLSEKDKEKILSFGIKTAIDLRNDNEVITKPNELFEIDEINSFNIQVMKAHSVAPYTKTIENFDMGDLYVIFLKDSKEEFKEIFDIIKDTEGGVFFNCAIGKDRTGVMAALILMLAGVSEEDVINNYAVSRKNLEPVIHDLIDVGVARHKADGNEGKVLEFLDSKPSYIKKAINHINEIGGIEKYFNELGFSNEDIIKIRSRII